MRIYLGGLLALLLSIGQLAPVSAQLMKRRAAVKTEVAPKAVFVQLFTGGRRLERSGDAVWKQQFRRDMDSVNKKIVLDFEDNFSYCPVYYFKESDYAALLRRELAGHLMDAQGNVLAQSPLAEGDTAYFILRYQHLVPTENDQYDASVTRRLLLAENYNGELLPDPQPRTTGSVSIKKQKMKKFRKRYRYVSKTTDMYYRPKALKYSITLESFYGKSGYDKKKK